MAEYNTIAEMRTILDAIEQGKEVQFRLIDGRNEWVKFVLKTPDFCSYRYRVKPEEPEKKWRPFKNVGEFLKAAGGKFSAIWLNCKDINRMQLVTALDYEDENKPICVGTNWESFDALLMYCTFLDGTPCGVLEEV